MLQPPPPRPRTLSETAVVSSIKCKPVSRGIFKINSSGMKDLSLAVKDYVLDESAVPLIKVPSIFEQACLLQIKELSFSDGSLSSLPASFSSLTRLKKIDISSNQFKTIPLVILGMHNIKRIDISDNLLSTLPDNLFLMSSLKIFIANDNWIDKIPLTFLNNPSLQSISLSNNPLLSPPCYIYCVLRVQKGIQEISRYLHEIAQEEGGNLFQFRYSTPFTSMLCLNCGQSSLTIPPGTHINTSEEVKQWRRETNQNYHFTMQSAVTMEQNVRPYMEDRAEAVSLAPFPDLLPSMKGAFLAVYDGHGGSHTVDIIKDNLREIIIQEWRKHFFHYLGGNPPPPASPAERDSYQKLAIKSLPKAILNAFEMMDNIVNETLRERNVKSGSTAVIILLIHNRLFSIHCGDSRAVLCRGGIDFQLTEDHKPDNAAERVRINNSGGFVRKVGRIHRVNGELSVSRSFGDCSLQPAVISTPVISTLPISPSDSYLIIASDGLWDVISNAEATQICNKAVNTLNACKRLTKMAIKKHSHDNISIIVVAIRWVVAESSCPFLNDVESAGGADAELDKINEDILERIITPKRVILGTERTLNIGKQRKVKSNPHA